MPNFKILYPDTFAGVYICVFVTKSTKTEIYVNVKHRKKESDRKKRVHCFTGVCSLPKNQLRVRRTLLHIQQFVMGKKYSSTTLDANNHFVIVNHRDRRITRVLTA